MVVQDKPTGVPSEVRKWIKALLAGSKMKDSVQKKLELILSGQVIGFKYQAHKLTNSKLENTLKRGK